MLCIIRCSYCQWFWVETLSRSIYKNCLLAVPWHFWVAAKEMTVPMLTICSVKLKYNNKLSYPLVFCLVKKTKKKIVVIIEINLYQSTWLQRWLLPTLRKCREVLKARASCSLSNYVVTCMNDAPLLLQISPSGDVHFRLLSQGVMSHWNSHLSPCQPASQ